MKKKNLLKEVFQARICQGEMSHSLTHRTLINERHSLKGKCSHLQFGLV